MLRCKMVASKGKGMDQLMNMHVGSPTEEQPRRQRPRGKPRDADATRDAILTAASQEFAEKGLYGARVEEIASRTSTSKHMIYYYFGSKDGLYAAVLQRVYAGFRSVEDETALEIADPIEALANLVGSSFDSHIDDPARVRIIMSENLDRGRFARTIDHSAQRNLVVQTLGRILERGEALGVIRKGIDPIQLHMSISALAFYYVSNAYTFSQVFAFDMTNDENRELRRAEVIETMLSRCRA
jgi:AcrR family transcriptional regulator